ncbi:hypothetical protein OROGR_012725 [Orobanche gracilis]
MAHSSSSCSHKILFLLVLHFLEYPIPINQDTSITIDQYPKPYLPPSNATNTSETTLTSANFGFLVDLRVGSQCLKQHLLLDTGSSLLWINCHPCVLDAPEPLFDPKTSKSFMRENCIDTNICDKTGSVRLGCTKDLCSYYIKYRSGESKGYLARDAFMLGASGRVLENIVFGCSKHAKQTRVNTGVLGLAGNRFFAIGDFIGVFEQKTRLMIEDKYFVNLESIRIGDRLLEVNPELFKRISADYTGGMVVDTGSTYTFLPHLAFNKFEQEVISLVDSVVRRNHSILYEGYVRHCYDGILTRDLRGFPKVYFRFEGGATMELEPENVFYQLHNDCFCLAILPSEVRNFLNSVLGNMMQQFFYVGFDLEAKEFKFHKADCAMLKDRYLRF